MPLFDKSVKVLVETVNNEKAPVGTFSKYCIVHIIAVSMQKLLSSISSDAGISPASLKIQHEFYHSLSTPITGLRYNHEPGEERRYTHGTTHQWLEQSDEADSR